MMYPRYVVKHLACPACGREERIRFKSSEMMREAHCSQCKVMIRWKRKDNLSQDVNTAFSDYGPEIARP